MIIKRQVTNSRYNMNSSGQSNTERSITMADLQPQHSFATWH